MSWRK